MLANCFDENVEQPLVRGFDAHPKLLVIGPHRTRFLREVAALMDRAPAEMLPIQKLNPNGTAVAAPARGTR